MRSPPASPLVNLPVVILNWNSAAQTAACAASLRTWQRLQPRLVVVDNASRPEERWPDPDARLLHNAENQGYAGGNNTALRDLLAGEAPPFILLLNSDAHLEEAAAEALVRLLEAEPEAAIAGPLLRECSGTQAHASLGGRHIAWHVQTRIWQEPAPGESNPRPVDYVPGTVALLRVAALRQVGLLDEAYFFSGELADWCTRARRAGWTCLVLPSAQAAHHTHPDSPLRETLYLYYSLRNRFRFVRKFHPALQVLLTPAWTLAGLLLILQALARGRRGRARAVALALADGLRGRFGNRHAHFLP